MIQKKSFLTISLCLLVLSLSLIGFNPNKSNALCEAKNIDPYYSGIFLKRSGQDYLTAKKDLNTFKQIDSTQRQKGLGMVDVDPLRANNGGNVLWAGVWLNGYSKNEFHAGLNLANFKALANNLKEKGLALIDAAPYIDNQGKTWWAGIWSPSSKNSNFVAHLNWNSLINVNTQQRNIGNNLVDIESYWVGEDSDEPGAKGQMFAGIWRPGQLHSGVYPGSDWNSFVDLANQVHKNGFHLIDVTWHYKDNSIAKPRQWVGLFAEHAYGDWITAGQDWSHFLNARSDFNGKGYLLIDMETYNPILKGEPGWVECSEG